VIYTWGDGDVILSKTDRRHFGGIL